MRGADGYTDTMFTMTKLDDFVPANLRFFVGIAAFIRRLRVPLQCSAANRGKNMFNGQPSIDAILTER